MIFSTITIDGTEEGNEWPLIDSKTMKYLLISSSRPVISKKPFIDEYKFWNSLPLLSTFKKSGKVLKTEL